MAPSISAVIPVHNRADLAASALDSVLAQTRPVDEILIVDDASSPPLDAAALRALDPRVSVLRLERNGGAGVARQRGIEAAAADVVAFLDSDDLWHPRKLELQLPLLGDAMTAVSCGWEERRDGTLVRTRTPIESDAAEDFLGGCWFSPGSTALVPRAAFDRVGGYDPRLRRLEDLDWFARFALHGGRLRVADGIGATIAIGRRARMTAVDEATDLMAAKARDWSLGRGERSALAAWLDVERARASINDGARMRAAGFLARSFLRRPRRRLHLRDWWRRAPR